MKYPLPIASYPVHPLAGAELDQRQQVGHDEARDGNEGGAGQAVDEGRKAVDERRRREDGLGQAVMVIVLVVEGAGCDVRNSEKVKGKLELP
ncbi:hypothetical protein E2C01_056577 [Portunus trituberculatus]|uniref:Uncharacterized protein n=1 Tax=Portunus trituberculatus TaxID=210409 RepID=A0A5B7GUI8_PORTR|nr:hypothetical protein [Portunus trituberculatus]